MGPAQLVTFVLALCEIRQQVELGSLLAPTEPFPCSWYPIPTRGPSVDLMYLPHSPSLGLCTPPGDLKHVRDKHCSFIPLCMYHKDVMDGSGREKWEWRQWGEGRGEKGGKSGDTSFALLDV